MTYTTLQPRPTAEIVADLREWDDGDNEEFPGEVDIHYEAADRLTELDAENVELNRLREVDRSLAAVALRLSNQVAAVNAALDQYDAATYGTTSTAAYDCVQAIREAVGR